MNDRSSGTVVLEHESVTIRIALDGSPMAGKTTAAYSLSEALGDEACTPEVDCDGRTLWFDWTTTAPDRRADRALRAEVVTVPAPTELADRREQLLDWADVVMFVVDTTPGAFAESAERFEVLRSELAETKPVVVVANKRDIAGALDIDEVRSDLGLGADDVLVEAVASTGCGVRQAFARAVRAALDALDGLRSEICDPDVLLEQLEAAVGPGEPDETSPTPQIIDFARFRLDPEGTGGPDVVLTATQWRVVARLANGAAWPAVLAEPVGASVIEQLQRRGLATGPDTPRRQLPPPASSPAPAVTPWFPAVPTFQTMVSGRESVDVAQRAVVAQPAGDEVDLKNEQYRALREHRRLLRG